MICRPRWCADCRYPDHICWWAIASHFGHGRGQDQEDVVGGIVGVQPLPDVGQIKHGQAVVALCGSDMAYLTGATIPLDGGQANFD